MDTREKSFNIRFSLITHIPEVLWEDADFEEDEWLTEWEMHIKPGLVRAIFTHLRSFPSWEAHIRNRGMSPLDEIEIVVERRYSAITPPDTPLQ